MKYSEVIGEIVAKGVSCEEFGIIVNVSEYEGDLALHIKWENNVSICSPYHITPVKMINEDSKD